MTRMRGWTRETRLLVVTVLLALSVLLALARLRFPGAEPSERLSLPTRPLQQIVERASFDDLAASVARAADRIRPALAVISLRSRESPMTSSGLAERLAAPPSIPARATALHIGNGRWVALVSDSAGNDVTSPGLTVAGQDELRGLVVLAGKTEDTAVLSTSRPALPSFLVVAEATATGVAVRPVFGPTSDTTSDPRWSSPLWALPSDAPPPGSLVFSLEGAFVGAVVEVSSGSAVVPGDAVLGIAATIDRKTVPWSIGIRLQPLDDGLAAALAADKGVVVAGVEPGSASHDRLAPGDVITAVDEAAVAAPDDVLFRVAAADPAKGIDVDVIRSREPVRVHIAAGAEPGASGAATSVAAATKPSSAVTLGAQLVPSPRGSRVRAVEPGSPAERAGVAAGDEIWWLQGTTSAAPAAIMRAWRALAPGRHLALGVDPEHPRLLTIARP